MPFVLVVVCSVTFAIFMAFGNPALWLTDEQQHAHLYATGVDGEDYDFLDSIAGDTLPSEFVVLGEYTAVSQDNDEGRSENLRLAAQQFNGIEIAPGQTISADQILGEITAEKGYQPAGAIIDGVLRQDVGGGVCQVTSALYIAALKANLTITERHPHSIASDYAPVGLDATFAHGLLDLKITNQSNRSVYVRAVAQGQTVKVRVYGTALEGDAGYMYDPIAKIVERFEKPASEVFGDPIAAGYAPDDPVAFYVTESYRVTYHNGTKEDTEHLSTDVYRIEKSSVSVPTEGGVDPTK